MPVAWIYILKGKKNGRYYIGSTINLEGRKKKHLTGQVYSTKRIGEVELVFSQKYRSLSEARKIENWIKRYKKRKLIDKIIQEGKILKTF